MGVTDKIVNGFKRCGDSFVSIMKVALLSKWHTIVPLAGAGEELVVLGNGPSLNDTMSHHRDFLSGKSLLAVNYAANSGMFFDLRPKYYVLADPLFFEGFAHENVASLWNNISSVEWKLNLFVPVSAKKHREWRECVEKNENVTIYEYNLTPVEGLACLEDLAFSSGAGMPRPRNVLIPSLMLALRMKFGKVYVAGADHSWTKTLSVTDDNCVVSVQPHFYEESKTEERRIASVYKDIPLYSILYSFYVAFKSYHVIERYARKCGVEIINITPGSFIDAFVRMKL